MKRLTIYATYTASKVNTDYIIYMIDRLSMISDVYMVSNCSLTENDKRKYSRALGIIERCDEGYDIGAYSYALNQLEESGTLYDYDELILLNDSIFGPFYSLTEMFDNMDKKSPDVDFWGITKRGINNFDGGIELYPEHIQLYFFVIRRNMFHDSRFRNYMELISTSITDFRSAIIKYEFAFTDYFSKLGYRYDTYCNTDLFITENPSNNLSPYHYCMFDLISKERCPFLKRKLFTGEFIDKKYTDASDLRKTFKYIDEMTDYDIDLIWSHILSTYSMLDIMKAMQLTEIIDSSNLDHYKDFMEFFDSNMVNHGCDCFFKSYDEYSIYIDLRFKDENPVIRNSMVDLVMSNLFWGDKYIDKICGFFGNEHRLGLLIPPIKTFGEIETDFCYIWNSTRILEKISDKYSLGFNHNSSALYSIRGFVVRNGILPESLIEDIKTDDTGTILQMLPYFVQKAGFYTKTIVNSSYFPSLIDNLSFISSSLIRSCDTNYRNRTIEDLKMSQIHNIVLSSIKPGLNIYIYGAGRFAQEIILGLRNELTIKGIVVSDTNGNTHKIGQYEVISINMLNDNKPFFIVAVGKKNSKIVALELQERGYNDFLIIE